MHCLGEKNSIAQKKFPVYKYILKGSVLKKKNLFCNGIGVGKDGKRIGKKKAICDCEVFWLPNSIFNQKHLTTSTLESSACQ